MSHACHCSLTLAGETEASRETRTFQVRGVGWGGAGGGNDFRFPTLAANKLTGEVTKCFLSKETDVSGEGGGKSCR